MKTRILSIVIILIVGILLFSYRTNSATPTKPVDVDTLRTEAVETYASSLTETLVAVPTTSPTPIIIEPTTDTPTAITATLETPATADPCYSLIWLEDVTIPDGTQLKPNEVFIKTWLVQNNGGCA